MHCPKEKESEQPDDPWVTILIPGFSTKGCDRYGRLINALTLELVEYLVES
jgi:hypothetical protein